MKQEVLALIWPRWRARIVLKWLESDLICLFLSFFNLITAVCRPLFRFDVVSGNV